MFAAIYAGGVVLKLDKCTFNLLPAPKRPFPKVKGRWSCYPPPWTAWWICAEKKPVLETLCKCHRTVTTIWRNIQDWQRPHQPTSPQVLGISNRSTLLSDPAIWNSHSCRWQGRGWFHEKWPTLVPRHKAMPAWKSHRALVRVYALGRYSHEVFNPATWKQRAMQPTKAKASQNLTAFKHWGHCHIAGLLPL